ncbi:MAG: hypothetical protein AAF721_13925 [Myxococcota bacterium]
MACTCRARGSGAAGTEDAAGTTGQGTGDSTPVASTSSDGVPDDSGGDTPLPATAHPSCLEDVGVILDTPASDAAFLAEGMTRYATVEAPDGGLIKIYAQDGVSELQIRRARSILQFFLTDVVDSMYGSDKGAVANAMVSNGAVLVLPNGEHQEGNEPDLEAQPLYWSETPVEGSVWYMTNDWEHRDAAYEEIFHLVHDTGIGTYVAGALPEYQSALDAEAREAIKDGRWGGGEEEWLAELEAEGSLAQEYIASVLDSYYGLWGAWDETPGGMWGIYVAKTRAEIGTLDPDGLALIEAFLPSHLTYEARLDPELSGAFSMSFDAALPYTHKSQYLVNVTLTGTGDADLIGNDEDNTLRGNQGDNEIEGGLGEDTVVYCRVRSEYTMESAAGELTVTGPDGSDVLRGIERIHFADEIVTVDDA